MKLEAKVKELRSATNLSISDAYMRRVLKSIIEYVYPCIFTVLKYADQL